MKIDLPFDLGAASIEWLLIGLPALALVSILMALIGGGGVEKQTRRRIERIRESNAPRLAQQSMVSIRLADNDSGIALVDNLVKHLLPRPELLRLRLARAGLRKSFAKYVTICLVTGLLVFGVLQFTEVVPLLVAVLFGLFAAIMVPHEIGRPSCRERVWQNVSS